jgi:hypothetical protein
LYYEAVMNLWRHEEECYSLDAKGPFVKCLISRVALLGDGETFERWSIVGGV